MRLPHALLTLLVSIAVTLAAPPSARGQVFDLTPGGVAGSVDSVTGAGTVTCTPTVGDVVCTGVGAGVGPSYVVLGLDGTLTAERVLTGTANQVVVTDGGAGSTVTLSLAAAAKIRTCTVIVGDPGSASAVLADDNDSPVACANESGVDWTISTVACWADAGSPTVTPILTGGSATSILTGVLTCGTAAWAAGAVQGTAPVVHSFSSTGATCSVTPCTLDVNITTAGGTAKYLVVKITGTLP